MLKTLHLFAISILLACSTALAQQAGLRVVDAQTELPISVAVLADDAGLALANSNEAGLLPADPKGAYVLAPGYKAHKLAAKEVLIRLQPLAYALQEVVATGLRPQTFALTDVSITGSKGIAPLGNPQAANLGQDVPYLVQQTPSAVTTSDAGTGIGYTGLRVRGSDATRTNVTLDGVPVNDAESQGTFWVNMPDLASSVGQVTVVRGVGSSSNGPGAFGASLMLQLRKPSDTAFVTVDNSAGSFGTRRHSVQLGTGRFGKGFTAEARLSRVSSQGYIDRASADMYSYLAVLRYQGKNGFTARLLTTQGHERTYQAWYGVPKDSLATNRTFNSAGTDFGQRPTPYGNETDNYGQTYWQLHLNQPLGQGWRLGGALFYTRGGGYFEQYKVRNPLAWYGLPGNDTADLVRRRWLANHYYGATATLRYDSGQHSFTLGTLASTYVGASFGRIIWGQGAALPYPDFEYHRSPSLKREASAFAKYSYTLPMGLQLYADVQVRGIDYRISGIENELQAVDFKRTFLFVNPKAAVGYDLGPGGQLSLSAAVAHREPTRATFLAPSGGQPRPERLVDYELSHRGIFGNLTTEATLFYMDYYDQLVQTGELNDVGFVLFKNVARSYRRGVELQARYKLQSNLFASGSVSVSANRLKAYSDTLLGADGNPQVVTYRNATLAYSPGTTAQGCLTWLPIKGAEVTLLGRYVGQQYLDNSQSKDLSLPAYGVADLRLAYELPKAGPFRTVRASVQINNVLNARYSNNGYTYLGTAYVFPQAPRHFLAGLTLGL